MRGHSGGGGGGERGVCDLIPITNPCAVLWFPSSSHHTLDVFIRRSLTDPGNGWHHVCIGFYSCYDKDS